MKRISILFAVVLIACSPSKRAGAEAQEFAYCSTADERQKLDFYPSMANGPGKGTIVYFHGGGYSQGDKREGFELRRALLLRAFGFDVVSANYRLAPQHRYPAQFNDALCALDWIRKHGPSAGLDTRFIGLMGDSAGGLLFP